MRALLLIALALPLAAGAQVPPEGISNAAEWRVIGQEDPARAAGEVADGWLALTLPAQPGTRSPCCWTGRWDDQRSRGCVLDDRQASHGNSDRSPVVRDLRLFARVAEGDVDRLLLAGPDCPVDAAGETISALDAADPERTLDWLDALARSGNEDLSHTAIYALAQMDGTQVTATLVALAREPGEWPARDAVFWLGEARGEAGARELDRLLDELPDGDVRRSVNFALSQNGSEQALDRLERVAREDRDLEQRSDALFWLAQSHADRARPLLLEVLDDAPNGEGMERAVFAVSQLSDGSGDELLFELASDPARPEAVRRQALFWLAQSDDEATIDRLVAMLTREQP